MSYRWRPKASYGPGPTVLGPLTWPCKPWDAERPSVGGIDWSATLVPASYVVNRAGDLKVTIRVTEAEQAAVIAWLEAVQDASSFDFWLDATGASVSSYLVSPAAGETIQMTRLQNYPKVFELLVTLRRVDGAAWVLPFYP